MKNKLGRLNRPAPIAPQTIPLITGRDEALEWASSFGKTTSHVGATNEQCIVETVATTSSQSGQYTTSERGLLPKLPRNRGRMVPSAGTPRMRARQGASML